MTRQNGLGRGRELRKVQSFVERLEPTVPKRLLAIDGGGIRGMISIEILARLQQLLRDAYRDPDLVLADYFDYVGGTSTGAIIATGISLGMTIEEIRAFYEEGARVMLLPAPFFQRWRYRMRATGITEALQKVLGDTRLGDPALPGLALTPERNARALRTLLLLVMYRCDTDSPWPLSNNPKAKYNDLQKYKEEDGNNMYLPLWKLVRASSAAPTYFEPEKIKIGDQDCIFQDGAITPYNNPSFLLYMMATLDPYNLRWQRGEENLLLVSIGTGSIPNVARKLKAEHMNLLYNAKAVPSALIYANTVESDKLCRVLGRCMVGESIDSEIGDLRTHARPKEFTYVRYDPVLTERGLEELQKLGLSPKITPQDVLPLISGKHVAELQEVGRAYAKKVELSDFGVFDPNRVPA